MDAIEKAIKKLTAKEREWIRDILLRLKSSDLSGLDIKKLKGRSDVFRIRKGSMRIIYRLSNGKIFILAVERRSDTTYN